MTGDRDVLLVVEPLARIDSDGPRATHVRRRRAEAGGGLGRAPDEDGARNERHDGAQQEGGSRPLTSS